MDPRVERLAELLAGYSLELGEGQTVRIDGALLAAPLATAVYRAAMHRGALPYADLALEDDAELRVFEGSDEQLTFIADYEWSEIERLDALLTVWSEANTRSLSRADPDRHGRYLSTRRRLAQRRAQRVAAGEMTWCGTLFPTQAHAQDAEMSLREYEDFVYRACRVDGETDPVAHWQGVAAELEDRALALDGTTTLRILGPDTDLEVTVAGRRWITACGKRNMPDGEVFTSPVETGTNGEIRYTLPAIFNGREVEDVRLRFEGGSVVAAEAARGDDYLRALLELDGGARTLGEVAFGLNYEIDRFTRNILFDEKIGGTMHLALGAGFQRAGSRNESALHWDMICDLRAEGEVYADGELVWQAGRFLADERVEAHAR